MGLHEFAQDDAALKARLDAAVDRLTEELDGIYDRETIRGGGGGVGPFDELAPVRESEPAPAS